MLEAEDAAENDPPARTAPWTTAEFTA